jgi:hypothetical protein
MLTTLATVGFLTALSFGGGALLGLISSETPRSEAAMQYKDNSRVAVDSVSSRAARVVAAKRKTSSEAAKRAAKTSSIPQASR